MNARLAAGAAIHYEVGDVSVEERELAASEDEIAGVPLIPSACVPRRGGQADAHPIFFKSPESSLA